MIDKSFIYAVKQIVGDSGWVDDAEALTIVEKSTFPTTQKVLGIILPRSTDEISRVLTLCGERGIVAYPVSRGCNWGLGSKVPLRTHSVLIDLNRMNQILDYNSEQGWIRVAPGTTFKQVSEFLKMKGDEYFLSVTGGAPHSSILANTLERGDGLGPLGDRSRYVASMEVVLGDGRILRTGFASFGAERVGHLTQDSLGPSLDGLFLQSNFAIVTGMTVWLCRNTKHYASLLFTVKASQATEALRAVRELTSHGIVRGNSFAFWNMQKVLASAGDHPLAGTGQPMHAMSDVEIQRYLPAFFKDSYWFGTLALYGISASHLRTQVQEARVRLKPSSVKFLPMTPHRARYMSMVSRVMPKAQRAKLERWIDAFYTRSVYRGTTSELSIRSLYWRKPNGVPTLVEPNSDGCGLMWLCHSVPFLPQDILAAEGLVKTIALRADFDPNVAFLCISERYVRMFVALMYDRDDRKMDARALSIQEEIHHALNKAGYPSFRLGIQSMNAIAPSDPVYHQVLGQLKQAFDPKGTLAPGRYDFQQVANEVERLPTGTAQ